MITQYDAIAEIEAMKAARPRRRGQQQIAAGDATPNFGWGGSEADIRAEMERRLARRAAQRYSSSGVRAD